MDIDQLARAMKDLEYRVRALEKVNADRKHYGSFNRIDEHRFQFCPCGRDVCRAPDCPSHKPDSMGR